MLKRIYINNYRNFQNFTIDFEDQQSALILGKNGSGKSNLFAAIEVFQKIGRGEAQLKELISKQDFSFNDTNKAIALELQVELNKQSYEYKLEIEWPNSFDFPKIKHEVLIVEGKILLDRQEGQIKLNQYGTQTAEFILDWHHAGLPLIFSKSDSNPVVILRKWFSNILILTPIPTKIFNHSKGETPYLNKKAENYLDWLRFLITNSPASYQKMIEFLNWRISDLELFKFETVGKDEKELTTIFNYEKEETLALKFEQLSDGEKIYFLTASLIALIDNEQSILCLWDEPDHYISLQELSHFIGACRKAFANAKNKSQIILVSHNARVINSFSENNIYFLSRKSHLHQTRVELLRDKKYLSPTLIEAYENGELEDGYK